MFYYTFYNFFYILLVLLSGLLCSDLHLSVNLICIQLPPEYISSKKLFECLATLFRLIFSFLFFKFNLSNDENDLFQLLL